MSTVHRNAPIDGTTPHAAGTVDADACYLALKTRDVRFDGRLFIGVTSTGIYCRPVCKVRTPKRENCRFFTLPAQAEHAGFRPCLRCRPELSPQGAAPGGDEPWSTHAASSTLARQAAHLLDRADAWCTGTPSAAAVAARLGVSERHLRRIFEAHWGVTALQYLQTRRLLLAKQLLTDTNLPMPLVAAQSGFGSVRRFNASFAEHYHLQPSALRSQTRTKTGGAKHSTTEPLQPAILLRAGYRPPYDVQAMLAFLSQRSVQGLESVDMTTRSYARTVALQHGQQDHRGWVRVRFDEALPHVHIQVSEGLQAVLSIVLARVHDLLDLQADPDAIHERLAANFAHGLGLRVPGTLDGFELGVRAILGQQITVAAARTLTTRVVQRWGMPVASALGEPVAALTRYFPSAQQLAAASESDLGELGIVRQRQRAILALARAVCHDGLVLDASAPLEATLLHLQSLPGIGAWTAHYIAMRALRWPDALVAGDVALQSALGLRQHPQAAREVERMAQAWRPWRSYAVLRAWNTPASPDTPPHTP